MIAALVVAGRKVAPYALAEWTAWGAVAGSLLQLAVQLPRVRLLAGPLKPDFAFRSPNVTKVVANFLPSVGSRGVTQVSSYVDQVIASFLPAGAVAALAYAQTLYLLPVSLFGMSISSAELPELSSGVGGDALRERLDAALRRVAFLVVPSAVAFAALGDRVAALVFQTGAFSRDDVTWVWAVLAGSSVGLLASTLARLYASAFWALHDTRTPLRFAMARVAVGAGLGALFAFRGPALFGLAPRLGLAGLTLGAGLAGWVEMLLLRRALNARVGKTGLPASFSVRVWGCGPRRRRHRLGRQARRGLARAGPPRDARLRRLRRRLRRPCAPPPRPRGLFPRPRPEEPASPEPGSGLHSTLCARCAECRVQTRPHPWENRGTSCRKVSSTPPRRSSSEFSRSCCRTASSRLTRTTGR